MSIDRRKLFALGGLGAVGIGTGVYGPELDFASLGITVRLRRDYKTGWGIIVPDWDGHPDWQPGKIHAVKTMPVAEFLAALDEATA